MAIDDTAAGATHLARQAEPDTDRSGRRDQPVAMTGWHRWRHRPQTTWLRRALFQVHLWTGLAIGMYVLVMSVTGSVLVYRIELNRELGTAVPAFQADRPTLTTDQIRGAAAQLYPGYSITYVTDRVSRRNPAFTVTVERGGETIDRLFDPYTAQDLGSTFTTGQRFVLWLVSLHDELLVGRTGRWWNGMLSGVFTVLVLTGLVVWWPGVSRWKRSLGIRRTSNWKRFTWDLHGALGIWLSLFLLMWGISGFYLGMPEPFTDLVDAFSDPDAINRPGDRFLAWLAQIHFGRFRGSPYSNYLKITWAIAGLAPAVLFVTGVVMWWNRKKMGPAVV
jgi:uncharacterized iron-regulated membrane protein